MHPAIPRIEPPSPSSLIHNRFPNMSGFVASLNARESCRPHGSPPSSPSPLLLLALPPRAHDASLRCHMARWHHLASLCLAGFELPAAARLQQPPPPYPLHPLKKTRFSSAGRGIFKVEECRGSPPSAPHTRHSDEYLICSKILYSGAAN